MSCATCHHPDLGFSNGQTVSTPRPGAPPRNVSALWNTGFNRFLLWDGREESLESQARLPLTLPNEMDIDPTEAEARLRAIPAYVELFDKAFGGSGVDTVTFDNVTRALAAFQRTLISQNSAYDRYVAGDSAALTPQQQRGMDAVLLRAHPLRRVPSAAALCARKLPCHGCAKRRPGPGGGERKGNQGCFQSADPTQRRLKRTLHAQRRLGHFGRSGTILRRWRRAGEWFCAVDPLLKGFDLTTEEKADLVAFLNALTDESQLPAVPEVALSGFPVVERIKK